MAGVSQDGQQAAQEPQRQEVVEVALSPALRFTEAAMCGWPPSQATRASALS